MEKRTFIAVKVHRGITPIKCIFLINKILMELLQRVAVQVYHLQAEQNVRFKSQLLL